jgi:hypothetical protein
MPLALQENPSVQYNYDNLLADYRPPDSTLQSQRRVNKSKIKHKKYYVTNTKETTFRIGDKIILYDKTVHTGRFRKLRL